MVGWSERGSINENLPAKNMPSGNSKGDGMLLLSNDDVKKLLTMRMCLDAMAEAFGEFAKGEAIDRPRSHTYIPSPAEGRTYMFKSFEGGIRKLGIMALRLSSDMLEFDQTGGALRQEKIPVAPGDRFVGLVLLFSIANCEPLAILHDGYLQSFRVGATYALGTKYMAREDARVLGLYGSGLQARSGIQAQCLVRDFKEVKVYSPNRAHREAFAREMEPVVKIPVRPVDEPHEVMLGSDVVLAATNSLSTVIHGEWIKPGMHVTAINNCYDEEAYRRMDLLGRNGGERPVTYVCSGAFVPNLASLSGETHADLTKAITLGDMILGRAKGRTSTEQVTSFGATGGEGGRGIQFAAVGDRILKEAKRQGIGREIPTEWFTSTIHS
jgi:ornithine cyclodeaminase/alanine dehydrogenase-like protein (mu-crystallin family)